MSNYTEEEKLIYALKHNKFPFGLMSEEMQAKAREIDRSKFYTWKQIGSSGGWCVDDLNAVNWPNYGIAYKLRPDYTEEPEIDECEVYFNKTSNYLYIVCEQEMALSSVVDHPDFIGFKYEGNRTSVWPRMYEGPNTFDNIVKSEYLSEVKVLTPTHCLFRRSK